MTEQDLKPKSNILEKPLILINRLIPSAVDLKLIFLPNLARRAPLPFTS